ncbi:AraC family transcriptional regulator [Peptostreptococcus sp. D1]|uniref:AraC family transcriptional regulator n=1 Tax=Peptostreptococcus sp. D1 TaxID=72304 RepID=UPI0008F18D23|nr:AraC family transcriptional regulator [Peptostreptococcus sp. D1]SFE95925.1 AraC-like ligand binding domain-containing protein [Peptostreptococcus sp. D1]
MDTIVFENSLLPVYYCTESISKRSTHSEISHWHDELEIIVVIKGSILCKTGNAEFELLSGDVCFINRKQLHRIHTTDIHESHNVLIIGTKLLMENPQIYDKFFRSMLEDSSFSHIHFTGKDSCAAKIKEDILAIEKSLQEKDCGYELDILSSIFRIGRYLYIAYAKKDVHDYLDNNVLIQQKMAEYIYAHFSESLTLETIAQSGNVSKSQASKLFKKYTGLSPISYLNRHRLEISLNLLRSTDHSIADIAQRCGFSDQSYFNRLFLREYGTTPFKYRNGICSD